MSSTAYDDYRTPRDRLRRALEIVADVDFADERYADRPLFTCSVGVRRSTWVRSEQWLSHGLARVLRLCSPGCYFSSSHCFSRCRSMARADDLRFTYLQEFVGADRIVFFIRRWDERSSHQNT